MKGHYFHGPALPLTQWATDLSWVCCDHITTDLVLSLLWSNNERSLFSWLSLASPNGLTGLVPGFVVVIIQALKVLLEPSLPSLLLWPYLRHESGMLNGFNRVSWSFVTIAHMGNRPFRLMDGATLFKWFHFTHIWQPSDEYSKRLCAFIRSKRHSTISVLALFICLAALV